MHSGDARPARGSGSDNPGDAPVEAARILVVDDDPALARMMRIALRANGFAVRLAANGEQALERIAEETADAILLDLQMPVMDGRAFFRELRARSIETPVIVVSAFGAEDAARELGAQASIAKPFDPDRLIDVIHDVTS